jgi:hypothetical protein
LPTGRKIAVFLGRIDPVATIDLLIAGLYDTTQVKFADEERGDKEKEDSVEVTRCLHTHAKRTRSRQRAHLAYRSSHQRRKARTARVPVRAPTGAPAAQAIASGSLAASSPLTRSRSTPSRALRPA